MISEKKDGIRTVFSSGRLMSRENKPIPNERLQKHFQGLPEGLDAELLFKIDGWDVYPPLEHINSIVTSKDKEWPKRWTPVLSCFDWQTTDDPPFSMRYAQVKVVCEKCLRRPDVEAIPHYRFDKAADALHYFNVVTSSDGEGICLRNPNALYKSGRATLEGGELMRFKKLMQGEAIVFGSEPLQRHVGERASNSFGLAKRDSKLTNMLTDETRIGALLCSWRGIKFKIGSGFTDVQRKTFAIKPPEFINFEYRDVTHKGVPRNATFVSVCPKS